MNEELKILLDRLETIAKKLDRYFFVQILFTLFGFTILMQKNEVMEIPVLDIKLNDPVIFHTILAASITAIFGIIGSGLLDYFSKRRLYDDQLEDAFGSVDKKLWVSLITRSQYENAYRSKNEPEVSRIVVAILMAAFLFFSNFIAIWHAQQVFTINQGWGSVLFSIVIVVLIILYASFWRTVFTRILKKRPQVQKINKNGKDGITELPITTLQGTDGEGEFILEEKEKEKLIVE